MFVSMYYVQIEMEFYFFIVPHFLSDNKIYCNKPICNFYETKQ